MNGRHTALAGFVAALVVAATVRAQATREVAVTVTAMSGREVYLSKGRSAGLRAGDIAELRPRGGALAKARIVDVSSKQSRALLDDPLASVSIGDAGRVRVPASRLARQPESDQARKAPDHPPWTGQLPWNARDLPLLAPTRSRGPSSRPPRLSGRAWARMVFNANRFDGTNDYRHYEVGGEMSIENPFFQGGELEARGHAFRREQELFYLGDDNDEQARVDRLSYRWGHASGAAVRFQVGRFLQTFSPYLGVVDGAEVDVRVGERSRVGASFGGFPDLTNPSPDLDFENRQGTVFYRYRGQRLQLGTGFQKTYYQGQADRDLAMLDVFWTPSDQVAVRGDLWVDYYDNTAVYKPEGFEVTEFRGSVNWRIDESNGMALDYNYFVWPELLRQEFVPVEPDSIRDDYVHRATIRSWHVLSDAIRLDLRAVPWKDQDESGIGANARMTLSTSDRSIYLALDAFRSDGAFEDGVGGRATLGSYGSLGSVAVSYEASWNQYDNPPIVDTVLNQAVSGTVDLHAFSAFDLSLSGEYRTGETQNALTATLYLQARF